MRVLLSHQISGSRICSKVPISISCILLMSIYSYDGSFAASDVDLAVPIHHNSMCARLLDAKTALAYLMPSNTGRL